MEQSKMGRPIQGTAKRSEKLTLRLSVEELQRIQQCADKLGSTRVNALIKGIELLEEKLNK